MQLTLRRLVVGIAVLFAAIAVAGSAAQADPGDFVNCEQNPNAAECVLNPKIPQAPGGGGGGGGGGATTCRYGDGQVVPCYLPGKGWFGGDACWYRPATGVELGAAEALGGKAVPPERWFTGTCGNPLTDSWPPGYVRFRLFGGQGPNLDQLADEAVRKLRPPSPMIKVNPELPTAQVVYVPTWLWVDDSSWGARSATATAGGLSVSATAKPVKVQWSTGDGASVTCRGRGTPWTVGTDPAKASPTCGHTYTTASAGGVYTVRATVTWEITWAGGGQTGTRPALTTTAAVDVRVVQTGTVNTGTAG
jgi:hypothetical protein